MDSDEKPQSANKSTGSAEVSQSIRVLIEVIHEFHGSKAEVTRSSIVHEIGRVNPVRTSARSGQSCAPAPRQGSIVSPIAAWQRLRRRRRRGIHSGELPREERA